MTRRICSENEKPALRQLWCLNTKRERLVYHKGIQISNMITRNQHFVWRHYLEGWKQENGLVNCLRNGKLFASNPRNVMAERDFYKLSRVTRSDVNFFLIWLQSNNQHLKKVNLSLFISLARLANANELIQNQKSASSAEKSYAQTVVIETEEKLHGEIERRALPLLRELRQKRTEFLDNTESAIIFFNFIAHQYFRIKRIRESIGKVLSLGIPEQDFGRLRNLLCYCFATDLGASLFVDRNRFEIIFLKNMDGPSFITGDQPVVNFMGTGDDSPQKELALYYPLSPDLSILLSPREYKLRSMNVTSEIVNELNEFIAWKSSQLLVAASSDVLQKFVNNSPSGRPLTCRILAHLPDYSCLNS